MVKQDIHQKILELGNSLTESETRLAQVVLENIHQLAAYSATELAELAHVSKATAVRFFKRLGYGSFSELRLRAREMKDTASPLYLMMEDKYEKNGLGYIEQHVSNEIYNIAQTFEQLDPLKLKHAISMLKQARRIYVVGFRSSRHLAHYMWLLLTQVREDVVLVPNNNGLHLTEELVDLGSEDLVLMMDYRRRVKLIRQIAEHAVMCHAKVLLFTDLSSSELPTHADLTLRTFTKSTGMFDSYTAIISLINALCTQVAFEQREFTQARLNKIEQLHDHYQDLDI
ncbi:MurR/RpiR family transcriptional regulator [Acinetobacter sp.]|uniref:MurR/RpiR family transcriptional regulator n=1 Tax=Acinetobacter sp. TaxID=472 RepID=UPI0031D5F581